MTARRHCDDVKGSCYRSPICMLSQETIEEAKRIYNLDPEHVKRQAKFGNIYERAAAITILQIVGVSIE